MRLHAKIQVSSVNSLDFDVMSMEIACAGSIV